MKNGNFTETFKGPTMWVGRSLPGWEVPYQVEEGYGVYYNPNWEGFTAVV